MEPQKKADNNSNTNDKTMKKTLVAYFSATGTTRAGRRKETAEDYRYFPEPDLVPIAPPAEWVEELRATLPDLQNGPPAHS